MSAGIENLFDRALELEGDDRRRFVRELTARDAELGAALARLLDRCDDPDSPLDRSPWRNWPESDGAGDAVPQVPERVGPYRISRELGRGGMGRVYLAEETTADFSRQLALKVIDRPFADAAAVRRFRDEVRILSLLDHPGIARFLHGGRSPEGTWYLALEYVDGVDLLSWADDRKLDRDARLRLFLAALEPVRYAHERGVIHRDLKPRHLLVDRDGRPRLLDFGISKLLVAGADDDVTATLPGARVLTPAYASPEQFRGEPATPASDVFALGVLLYELIAGRRPFEPATRSVGSYEKAVLTTDPDPPSATARHGSNAPGASADLDAICLKALRKRPEDRYRDAGELAADLERCLDGHAVEARRGQLQRAVGRLLRRRGVALAATTALVVLVAALALRPALQDRGATGTAPAAPRPVAFPFTRLADTDIAQLEREFAADPASLVAGARLALALEQKRRLPEAQLIASRLRQIPGADGDPLLDYVDATLANASDEPQRALVLFTRARDGALARSRGELLGQVRAARGRLLSTLGEREEAYREMALARGDFESAGDDESLARVLNDLAIEHLVRGELAEGQDLLERSIGAAKRSGTSPTLMLSNLGQLASFRGDPATGDRLLREAVADRRREGNPYRLGEVLTLHAEALDDLGRRDEAVASLDEAAAMLREADDQSVLLAALQLRGAIAASAGDFDRAGQIAAELQRYGTETGNYLGLSGAFLIRGLAADASGDRDEMRRGLTGAAHLANSKGHHDYAAAIEAAHAAAELRTGDSEAAAELARRALDRLPAGSSTAAPRAVAAAVLARVEVANRRLEAALSLLSAFGNDAEESSSVSRRIALLTAHAALDRASGRSSEALARLDRAIELARRSGRRFEELELRITRVDSTLELSGDGGRDADADRLRRQASTSGFSGLARRAGSP